MTGVELVLPAVTGLRGPVLVCGPAAAADATTLPGGDPSVTRTGETDFVRNFSSLFIL